MKRILFTICGRAGSKGVKNKNIRPFLGRPLVLYTLEYAKYVENHFRNKYLIDIAVNSDSPELLHLAKNNGINNIVVRAKELSEDNVPKVPVIIDTTVKTEKQNNYKFDYVIDLDITSPIRYLSDLMNGLDKMFSENYDCVFSVVEARRNPWFNMVYEDNNGNIKKVLDSEYTARQQAPKIYDMNASIYIYKRNSFFDIIQGSPFDGKTGIFQMEDYGILDIDSEKDFELMEVIFKHIIKKRKPEWIDNLKMSFL